MPTIHFEARDAQILHYKHGLIYKRSQKERYQVVGGNYGKRSKITSFSRNSARNMRNKLIKLPDVDGVWGVTFTFQKDAFYTHDIEYFRCVWQKFLSNIRLRVPEWSYLFWRCELTKKGVPHFHTLIKCDNFENIWNIQNVFLRYIEKYYKVKCPPEVAVNIRRIDGFEEAYNYVSSHATKHKQSQLGWKGRQWGILFRCSDEKKLFVASLDAQEKEVLANNASYGKIEEIQLNRILRKLYYSKFRSQGSFTSISFKLVYFKGMGIPTRSIKQSSRKLAYRQSQQSGHFLCCDTLEKLKRCI